jgi:hypothetical protein
MADTTVKPKAARPARRMPTGLNEIVRTVYRLEAKMDYAAEENRAALRKYDDHETRLRSLEASDSKRQGGSTMARFLYGAVWPAVTLIISATALYLQYKATHP